MPERNIGAVQPVWADRWGCVPFMERRPEEQADEADWERVPVLSGFRHLASGRRAQLETRIRLAYDQTELRIQVQAALPEEEPESPARLEQVDLILSPSAAGDVYAQLPIVFSNRSTKEEAGLLLIANWDAYGPIRYRIPLEESAVRVQVRRTPEGWEAEAGIPWRAFGELPSGGPSVSGVPVSGAEWRFNAIRYREGERPVSSWLPLQYSYFMDNAINTKPDELRKYVVGYCAAGQGWMGSLFFGGEPSQRTEAAGAEVERPAEAERADDGAKPAAADALAEAAYAAEAALERAVPWVPAGLELLDVDFATKELAFELPPALAGAAHAAGAALEARWRHPSGRTVAVPAAPLRCAGGRCTARLHPPPPAEAGVHQLHLRLRPQGQHAPAYAAVLAFEGEALIAAGEARIRSRLGRGPAAKPPRPADAADVPAAPPSAEVRRVCGLIPDQPGFLFAGVPHDPLTRTDAVYRFDPEEPDRLTAVKDGTVYPNERYPEREALTVRNRRGEEVAYPYHEADDGRRYFITAHLWFERKKHALAATRSLAEQDPLGAARVLYRWVQQYEGYVPGNDYIWRNYPVQEARTPPYPYWGGIMARWFCLDLYELTPLIETYAAVRRTNAFERLSEEAGEDVEERFVRELLLRELEYVKSYVVIGGNLDYLIWLGYIRLGRALEEPDLIHRAVELMRKFAESQFLADGFWNEVSLSYHEQAVQGFRQAIRELEGWSDPPGYLSPRDGTRFDELDVLRRFPALAGSVSVGRQLVFPNGRYVPLHDTWASDTCAEGPLTEAQPLLLPNAGVAKLAAGAGPAGETQLLLNFAPKYGHHHADPLGLVLFAQGEELLPDIGYTYTRHRLLYVSTFAHNTVVVDGRDMALRAPHALHGGRVNVFAPLDAGLQIAAAQQETAFPGTGRYMRELWWVGFEGAAGGEGYAVDLFRVSGGSRHEYTLNGPANVDCSLQTEAPLEPYGPYLLPPGTPAAEPKTEYDHGQAGGEYYGYLYMQEVSRAEAAGGRYELTFAAEDGTPHPVKLRVSGFVEPGANELFAGRATSLRKTRTSGPRHKEADINAQLERYFLPKVVLRREGERLRSLFATVLEPYRTDASRIERIERLDVELPAGGDSADAAALAVTSGEFTDYLISSCEPGLPVRAGELLLQGRAGFVRVKAGRIVRMRLIGGTRLRLGETELAGTGPVSAKVIAVHRRAGGDAADGWVTAEPIDGAVTGRYAIVTLPNGHTAGYRLTGVSPYGAGSLLTTEFDPGLELDSAGRVRQIFYPCQQWQGEVTLRIDNVAEL